MDFLNQLVSDVNGVLWGVFFLIPLLCGTGIFYTIKLRFVQVRKFGLAARFLLGGASLFGKRADKSGMSSFQALATAVAAQVGTGNVAGTATALVAGGPGSLFWLWVAAFFGMATIFAEAVLAHLFADERRLPLLVNFVDPAEFVEKRQYRRQCVHSDVFVSLDLFAGLLVLFDIC